MSKQFASAGDMAEKRISFTEIGPGLWAFTAEGDPNTGVIIGDDAVMIVEAQATPRLARMVIERVREVTDKPIRFLALTHYHAVRVLGASAYGAENIIMSDTARATRNESAAFVTLEMTWSTRFHTARRAAPDRAVTGSPSREASARRADGPLRDGALEFSNPKRTGTG